MFPNSPEREKLKHGLGRVLRHGLGSPAVFGSDNIQPLTGFTLTRGVPAAASPGGSCPSSSGRGQSPRPGHGPPRSGCSLQTAAQLPGSVFPTSGTNSLTTDTTNPHQPSPTKAPSAPQAQPRQVSPRAVPARWDTGAGSISNTQIPGWRDGNGTITCSNSCAVTQATAGTR